MKHCDSCFVAGFERDCRKEGRCIDQVEASPEKWVPVPGFERMHHVSSAGRFRNMTCPRGRQMSVKVVAPTDTPDGPVVYLNRPVNGHPNFGSVLLAYVVLLAFTGEKPNKRSRPCFRDGNRMNVTPENLHWST